MKNIIIAGLGLHARHCHYKTLEKLKDNYDINIKLVIDLKDQEEDIMSYIRSSSLKPEQLLFLDNENRTSNQIPNNALNILAEINTKCKIDGIIVSTEPKCHKQYVLWAIENGIDILLDKPLTAPILDTNNSNSAKQIYTDYLEIEQKLKKSDSKILLVASRRKHKGYTFIRDYLDKFIDEFEIPITNIEIYHSEGMWNMPDEFLIRENHPYKYGYGLMLHSGYHFVDLFLYFAQLNQKLRDHSSDTMEIVTKHVNAYDFINQINHNNYKKIFGNNDFNEFYKGEMKDKLKDYGETDVNVICQLKSNDSVNIMGSLNILQTGFSRRAWTSLPKDTYRKNGRVRHERLNINVGHLLNIQAHSYSLGQDEKNNNYSKDIINPEDFHILTFRNTEVVGGDVFSQYTISDSIYQEYNGEKEKYSLYGVAKVEYIRQWLDGDYDKSDFYNHRDSILMLSKIYESMFKQNCGLSSDESLDIRWVS